MSNKRTETWQDSNLLFLIAQKFYQMKYEVTLLYGIIQKLSEP